MALTALPVLPFPAIDPVLFEFGPIVVRWYALAYLVGLIAGWRYIAWLNRRYDCGLEAQAVEDLLVWITLGVILGGRFGYVLFYNLDYFLQQPLSIFYVWQGGMSFHGGMLGVIVAAIAFCHFRGIALLSLTDLLAAAAPIGLFFGRLANFINGELYGRASDVPWAMIFPTGGPYPRHPSQLYEALLEGLLLFILLFLLIRLRALFAYKGAATGIFLIGYSVGRIIVEFFREPDPQLGLLFGGFSMGQWLSAPMLLLGAYLLLRARHRPSAAS